MGHPKMVEVRGSELELGFESGLVLGLGLGFDVLPWVRAGLG